MAISPEPEESSWAELREAQLITALNDRNIGLATIIDIGEAGDIHPKNKQDVGKRLALWALAKSYGRDIVFSGPVYQSMKIEEHRIRLKFSHTAEGLQTVDNRPLKGFAIAGEDRKYVWADAEIEGNEVVVWSDQIAKPVAVRYAWGNNPVCNLYNSALLPAVPFRTDNWQVTTDNSR